MVRLSIVFDRIRWEEKILFQKAKKKARVTSKYVDAKLVTLDTDSSKAQLEEEYGDVVLQRCISYYRGLHHSAFLDSYGLKVVNNSHIAQVCGNKVLTTLALKKAGVPTPRTMLSLTSESALKSVEKIGLPAVLKPVIGSWGRMVVPLRDLETTEGMIEMREQMNGPMSHIFYVQEMVKRPDRDIRTIVVGEQLLTAVYRNAAPGEWRTNVARGGSTTPCEVTSELEDVVLKAAEAVGGGVLGVDAMESPDGIVVHEVNNTVEFKGAASASRADIPSAIIDYAVQYAKR